MTMPAARAIAALAGLTLIAAMASPAAASPAAERFFASGGNYCEEGGTIGRLRWEAGAPIYQVHVEGIVTARTVDHDDPRQCFGRSAKTEATYSAYTNGWLVARDTVVAVDGATPVDLDLVALAVIDLVVVTVCWPPDVQSPEGDLPDLCFSDEHSIRRSRA
jgi:hypothetical protein